MCEVVEKCVITEKDIVENSYDEEVLAFSESLYNDLWALRCSTCLSPCCFFGVGGKSYKPLNKEENDNMVNYQKHWTKDFIIMAIRTMSWDELHDMAFDIRTSPPELVDGNGLQVCPLNIDSKCLIYEDRPIMCKIWKCIMKADKGVLNA